MFVSVIGLPRVIICDFTATDPVDGQSANTTISLDIGSEFEDNVLLAFVFLILLPSMQQGDKPLLIHVYRLQVNCICFKIILVIIIIMMQA